jgi:hypothetical protein
MDEQAKLLQYFMSKKFMSYKTSIYKLDKNKRNNVH